MSHRRETVIDYQSRILKAQLYLQAHLDKSVPLEELARVACFSPYHFHRIFAAFVGETLSQYTRRLRLERAATQLQNSTDSITDIAMRSGYETPASFGKAFKQRFSLSPTQFRQEYEGFRAHQLVLAQTTGVHMTMKATIRQEEPRRVLFVRKVGDYHQSAREAWSTLYQHIQREGITASSPHTIGISHDNPEVTEAEHRRYDACIPIAPELEVQTEGEVGVQTLDGGRFAVFEHLGPYTGLGPLYNQIFSQWFPNSGEALRDANCFEVYHNNPATTAPEALRTEIYLPLQDK